MNTSSEPRRIILMRHGETKANREGRVLGSADSPLTAEGLEAANKLTAFVSRQEVGTVFSSPLGRAVTSAGIYTQEKKTIVVRPALAELCAGEWELKLRADVVPGKPHIRPTWWDRPPGGESYADAETRMSQFLEELRVMVPEEPVLLVGHAGINRVFLKLWLDLSPDYAVRVDCPHDTAYVLNGRSVSGFSVSRGPIHELLVWANPSSS
ncbi:histidine phosphatase family protein [Desulfomonile tiedjei]|uniref:Fructose-2,6-bisphosphatase n=1 Tax=Desulfomonile tiedjei (strain ATCC 49306 / DSM 6799 / DCB-1) TaxID=706587 RepID=I4C2J2_DESTA|nr:histidine phosphatase family protein [Desulfomonile tiedjei]AFM23783.1 fructose-2,6-bisphosphatase [Desulfomonile tiedjei DSM 6799]